MRLGGNGEDIGDTNGVCHDLTFDVNDPNWYHVALVWDGSAVKFYVNGVQSQQLGPNSLESGPEIPFTGPIGDSDRGLGIGCIVRGNSIPPSSSGQFFHGRIDEVRISDEALDPSEFLLYGVVDMATGPYPYNGADVCPRDVNELSWRAVKDAKTHDIYFGTGPNDVNESADPCVVGHDSNCWKPPSLELGVTYYWRIDEVYDGNVWPGGIWGFTLDDG